MRIYSDYSESVSGTPGRLLPAGATVLTDGYYNASINGATLYACKKTVHKAAKSTDAGSTWTDFDKVFGYDLASCFVTKDGILLACEQLDAGTGTKIWRSVDDGANWVNVFDTAVGVITTWGWAQAPGGNIFCGEYSNSGTNSAYIWISTDDGANWTRKDGLITFTNKHIHQVMVDPTTSRLYATIGDGYPYDRIYYSDNNADTWTRMFTSYLSRFTGATSLGNARYFGDDNSDGYNHIWKTTDDATPIDCYFPESKYNTEYSEVVGVDGGTTLFTTFMNANQAEGKLSIVAKSTDSGDNWSIIAIDPTGSGKYQFHRPVMDYRHRIPSGFGYFICNITQIQQMIRMPI